MEFYGGKFSFLRIDKIFIFFYLSNFMFSVCKNSMIIRAYNVHASSLVHPSMGDSLLPVSNELEPVQVADIFRPALALPVISTAKVTRAQAALHLLCCLDSLTRCQQVPLNEATSQDAKTLLSSRCHSKEDYSVVNRFESTIDCF